MAEQSANIIVATSDSNTELLKTGSLPAYESLGLFDLSQKLIIPALADIHFHWVQDSVCKAPKANLFQWLEKYTYPTEASFADRQFSLIKAQEFAQELIKVGTLYGATYGSVHGHSTEDFFAALPTGLRSNFIAGSMSMTRGEPNYLVETETESLEKTRKLINKFNKNYAFSPRFMPSVSSKFLAAATKLVQESSCWTQTHLAETQDPEESNIKPLETAQLLGPKTILGHCIYLSNNAWSSIAKSRSKIAHCPSSNAPIEELGLGSGLFDYERAEDEGIDWGLASDIGAGPYLSMLDVMQSFVHQHRRAGRSSATATKALYRASLKNTEILGLSRNEQDYIVLDASDLNLKQKPEWILEELLELPRERLNRLIEATYYNGVRIA